MVPGYQNILTNIIFRFDKVWAQEFPTYFIRSYVGHPPARHVPVVRDGRAKGRHRGRTHNIFTQVFLHKCWEKSGPTTVQTSGESSEEAEPGVVYGVGGDESKRQRAESQRIVAARPLCRLQYPVAYLSRLQRILPAARWELYFKAAHAARPPRGLGQRHVPLGAGRPLLRVGKRTAGVRVASSPDSDLEAFSHNPAHGSFAPLAFQPSAMTNCANQRFLSY